MEAKTIETIYNLLVEKAGMDRDSNCSERMQKMKKAEFVEHYSEGPVPHEYWFRSSEASDMKLFFSGHSGFRVYSQIRSERGIAAEEAANKAFKELGYSA